MTAVVETVEGYDWLDEMTGLYGKPRTPKPIRNGGRTREEWLWPSISVRVFTEAGSFAVEATNLRHAGRHREASVRAWGAPDEWQVRRVLAEAGLLPCPVCRGLKEISAGRDGASERWTACVCTGPSPRPLNGYAQAVARG